jgi:hypothetical protein
MRQKEEFFRRRDGKYLLYVPEDLAEDSIFPFKENPSVTVADDEGYVLPA